MLIYKIATTEQWREAQTAGVFRGAPIDLEDGYIHFSTGEQVRGTLAKHFVGMRDLLLIAVDSEVVVDALRWEVSRDGALFPHLYATLPVSSACSVHMIPDDHRLDGLL